MKEGPVPAGRGTGTEMKGKCMKRIILAGLVLSLLLGGLPALAEYTDPDDEDLLIEDIIEAPEEEKKEVLDRTS